MPNANVLPEPVGALPHTSRPSRASGMVAAWIGVGVVMARVARARAIASGTPRSAKRGTSIEGRADKRKLLERASGKRRATGS